MTEQTVTEQTTPKFELGQRVKVQSLPNIVFTVRRRYWSHGEWVYTDGHKNNFPPSDQWGEEDDLELVENQQGD